MKLVCLILSLHLVPFTILSAKTAIYARTLGDKSGLEKRIKAASEKLKSGLLDTVKSLHPEHVFTIPEGTFSDSDVNRWCPEVAQESPGFRRGEDVKASNLLDCRQRGSIKSKDLRTLNSWVLLQFNRKRLLLRGMVKCSH